MPRSFPSTDIAMTMLRNLMAAEALADSLAATAPAAVAEAGGANSLVASMGHPTGALFWSISPVPAELWERMADEHQVPHRANLGGISRAFFSGWSSGDLQELRHSSRFAHVYSFAPAS